MIEKRIIDYLGECLDVPVYGEQPEDKPDRYIIVEKTGGGGDRFIARCMMAVFCHAESLEEAAVLNTQMIGRMFEAISIPQISKVELNTESNFSDIARKAYEYYALFDLVYAREEI